MKIKLYRIIFTFYLNFLHRKNRYKLKTSLKPRLFFGTVPLINNKYWSNALKQAGYKSDTVMVGFWRIHKREDFDLYINEVVEKNYKAFPAFLRKELVNYLFFDYAIKNYDIFHLSFRGLYTSSPNLYFNEGYWLKKFEKKVIMIPYGYDYIQYSRITIYSYLFGLWTHYPEAGLNEAQIKSEVDYWTKYSEMLVLTVVPECKPNWGVVPFSCLCIDIEQWIPKTTYSDADGINETVYIAHSPNHRALKGTEFVIDAVDRLKKEGLKVELLLLEKMMNEEVKIVLSKKTDILVEQLIIGYALSGIEGMALGLPVISNLENESYVRPYRRYSYLNECPILSSTPESIVNELRLLVKNPDLRRELGVAGTKYVAKYHSPKSAVYMFEKIYDKIWYNKKVDLMNLYHPLNPESYNNSMPKIEHPLFENKIPLQYYSNIN
jgi:glycosyltransferase involved in cell wall biosynthesis